tara:strand:+ start:5022 stop:5585 length:564 start_codon:yes stop_codon:yes gene_type:complete
MNLIDNIKYIVNKYIEKHYNQYLTDNNILKIKSVTLETIIRDVYEKNARELKNYIRSELKTIYGTEYPSVSVENILLDLFQDKEIGINKLIEEITIMQNNNTKIFKIPVINDSININIEFKDKFIVIKNIDKNKHSKEIYDELSKYHYLYSINEYILEEYETDKKIEIIKNCTKYNSIVTIECYILK